MRRVTAQVRQILLLIVPVPDGDCAICHCGLSRSFRMSAVTSGGYHATRHVTLKFIPEAATTAQTDSTVTDFIIRFVVNIAEAERPGIEAVFICRRRGSDNRTIELGVVADRDIEAAISGKH
ncbi:TPA: hypothetical protein QEQ76_004360, partial [Escherichia coli]|nr:hypothetical protein [Escherichia coli]HCD2693886.1 hypothetical protein [Escherichia coli]HCD6322819.1 hypothetical protein [Escherichia coli]HDD8484264.1 hypothetical protein [Escherichia coli]HDS1856523.1 hypothetical protein [Escherichia coli]